MEVLFCFIMPGKILQRLRYSTAANKLYDI